jgi:hypothetical protein
MDMSSLSSVLSSSAIPGDIKEAMVMKEALAQQEIAIEVMKKVMETQQTESNAFLQMLGKTVPPNSDAMAIDVYV